MVTVSVRRDTDGSLVVGIAGRMERAVVERARKDIVRALRENPRGAEVVADLSDLEALDTAGAALLVLVSRLLRKSGKRFRVIHSGDAVARVLRLTQVEDLLSGGCGCGA